MNELSSVECEQISGGSALAWLGLAMAIIGQSEAGDEFFIGPFDRAGTIR